MYNELPYIQNLLFTAWLKKRIATYNDSEIAHRVTNNAVSCWKNMSRWNNRTATDVLESTSASVSPFYSNLENYLKIQIVVQ